MIFISDGCLVTGEKRWIVDSQNLRTAENRSPFRIYIYGR